VILAVERRNEGQRDEKRVCWDEELEMKWDMLWTIEETPFWFAYFEFFWIENNIRALSLEKEGSSKSMHTENESSIWGSIYYSLFLIYFFILKFFELRIILELYRWKRKVVVSQCIRKRKVLFEDRYIIPYF
jgi:hypothetical protein